MMRLSADFSAETIENQNKMEFYTQQKHPGWKNRKQTKFHTNKKQKNS